MEQRRRSRCCRARRASSQRTDTIHDSVLQRWQADASYRPEAMNAVAGKCERLQTRGVIRQGDLDALVALPLVADASRRWIAPISPMFATCVPPHGCRSIPGMRSSRTRPAPRGGCTLIVLTSSGRASSSSSVIQTVSVAIAARHQLVRALLDPLAHPASSCRCRNRAAPCRARCCRRSPARRRRTTSRAAPCAGA